MMREDVKFNTAFVRAIEKNPCIYDYNNQGYFDRVTQDEAWTALSIEMRGTVEDCKTRWKNLRASLTRYLKAVSKAGDKHVKPYYLVNTMQFLMPFLKPRKFTVEDRTHSSPLPSEPEIHISEDSPPNYQYDGQDDGIEEHYSDYKAVVNPMGPNFNLVQREQMNANSPSAACNVEYSPSFHLGVRTGASFGQRDKKRKFFLEPPPEEIFNYFPGTLLPPNPDLDFYKSILPDIAELNPHRKRKFKQRILQLIDEFDTPPVNYNPNSDQTKLGDTHVDDIQRNATDTQDNDQCHSNTASVSKDDECTNAINSSIMDDQVTFQSMSESGINCIYKRKRSTVDPSEEPYNNYAALNNSLISNPDFDFFKSILPDTANFTPHLKRKFKSIVLQLIDDVE